jgi:hypothetical protein
MSLDIALIVPLVTILTPDLSELGLVFLLHTIVCPIMLTLLCRARMGLCFFFTGVYQSAVSELLTDCEFQRLVHCSVSSFFFSLYFSLNQRFQAVRYQALCFHLNIGG